MADVTNVQSLHRPGSAGNSGDTVDLALKEFKNMVLLAYEEHVNMDQMHQTMTVGGGAYVWQFPVMGKATAKYHQAGDNLLTDEDAANVDYGDHGGGTGVKMGERLIYADNEMVASQFVPRLDEKIIHYEYRQNLAKVLARAVRLKSERNKTHTLYNTGLIAADSLFTGSTGGTTIANNTILTDSDTFVSEIFQAQTNMDVDEVPTEGRYIIMPPSQRQLLFNNGDGSIPGLEWLDKDFRGDGSIARGVVGMIAGFQIVINNYLPVAVGTTGDAYNIFDSGGTGNDYSVTIGANAQTAAIAFQQEAFGTTMLEGLQVEVSYHPEYRGHLVQVCKVEGSGPLRPECVNILTDAA